MLLCCGHCNISGRKRFSLIFLPKLWFLNKWSNLQALGCRKMEYPSVSPSSEPLKLSLAVFLPPTEAPSDHESSLVCLKTLCLCSPLCIHLLLSLLLFVSPTLPPLCFDVDRSWFPSFTWIYFIFFKCYSWIKIKFTCLCFGINIVFSCGYPWNLFCHHYCVTAVHTTEVISLKFESLFVSICFVFTAQFCQHLMLHSIWHTLSWWWWN